uniref:Reverse transcriptase domain-containing protein n=1 Tax=Cannabis sativa TaxID=3483 RepID=A0A803PBV4_CANSA
MVSSSSTIRDLEDAWTGIRLDEEDGEEFIFEGPAEREPIIDTRWYLVGRLLTGRVSDFQIFQHIMADLWKPVRDMYVKELSPNLFLFQFYHEMDIHRVIIGSPWTFDRKHLILERLKEGDNPRAMKLEKMYMWVQIHDLQPGCMTEAVVRAAGVYLGGFVEIDPNNFTGVWKDYLRIPTFCFLCGIMGHSERFCEKALDIPIDSAIKPYGKWMIASSRRANQLVGSRWLRSGRAEETMDTGVFNAGAVNGGIDPHVMAVNNNSGPNFQRSLYWNVPQIVGTTNQAVQGSKERYGTTGTLNITSPITLENDTLTISDLKRRRIELGLDNGPRGDGSMVNMDSEIADGDNESLELMDQNRLGFEACFSVDPVGRKGGLALFWKVKEEASLLGYSNNHIDVEISQEETTKWRLTGLYGEPNCSLRHQTWTLIRTLRRNSPLPWCVIGDINNIGSLTEQKGGRPYPNSLINGFQEMLTLLSSQWIDIFNDATLTNLEFSSSDHTPILLEPTIFQRSRSRVQFRFENSWTHEPMCYEIVNDCWRNNPSLSIQDKIRACASTLATWGKDYTGGFKKRIAASKRRMKLFKGKRQRAKQFRLRYGGKNSKYFHAMASSRKRNNKIQKLLNSDGVWVDWDGGLDQLITAYFESLNTAGSANYNQFVSGIVPSVSPIQNADLLADPTDDEIRSALFHMHPDKSSGPDGMGPGFFQKHWDIVGCDVIQLVRNFFETSVLPRGLNATNLVLIPKKKNPSAMGELRPIALCNVPYKIVSKVLANRMKGILDHVVSETQSAFIPGRLISDNIMVAFEVMHFLKRKTTGRKGFMAIKLDMSKAYDRVEWSYLRAIMIRMGFDDRWVEMILHCVSTVQYSVVHGEHVMGPITPTRGLRQGDPLSPSLFILCAEGLSNLIGQFVRNNLLQGIRVARVVFEEVSGQKVNTSKSSIFFSPNTTGSDREQICGTLGMVEASEESKYLGLPNIIGRNKSSILGFLKEKVKNRINSWDGKLLSRVGKEILLKTIVQSLPTYAMSVFLLPLKTCDELQKMMAKYWWKTSSSKGRGITWMSWERMARDKKFGGVRRIVGTGLQVDILTHPWLPNNENPYVTSINPGLINQPDMFNQRDVNLILSIPISFTADGDFWSWRGESSGEFSLKIPQKVKNFLWRVCSACLPTRVQLHIKHVPLSLDCPLCGEAQETEYHLFVSCVFATACWSRVGLPATELDNANIVSWFIKQFEELDEELICRVAMISWAIWKAQNSCIWKDKRLSIVEVLTVANATLHHWRKAQHKDSIPSYDLQQPGDGNELWIKPDVSVVKVNVDAAFFEDESRFGFGMVARDYTGRLLDACCQSFHGQQNVAAVEVLGVKEALCWIKGKQWYHAVIETDSKLTVQAVRSSIDMKSVFGLLVEDCRCLFQAMPNASLCFVNRSASRVAHYVARQSRFYADRRMLSSNVSVIMQNLLYQDSCY